MLLEDGRADPCINESVCLTDSASNGHIDIVKMLLEDGRADPSDDTSDCLKSSAQLVQMLLNCCL